MHEDAIQRIINYFDIADTQNWSVLECSLEP